eukprot:5169336-Pyramimonas_sp.AAC.1
MTTTPRPISTAQAMHRVRPQVGRRPFDVSLLRGNARDRPPRRGPDPTSPHITMQAIMPLNKLTLSRRRYHYCSNCTPRVEGSRRRIAAQYPKETEEQYLSDVAILGLLLAAIEVVAILSAGLILETYLHIPRERPK